MSLTREQDEFITALYKEMFKKLVNIGYELLGNVALADRVQKAGRCDEQRESAGMDGEDSSQPREESETCFV